MGLFTPIDPEFQVNTTEVSIDFVSNPDVGVADDGSFVVVWEEPFQNDEDDLDIRFRRYDVEGKPLDAQDFGVATTSDSETSPAIAVAPDGSFVVTYVKDDDIYARIFANDGFAQTGEILVSTFEQDKEQFDPDITIDAEGDFAIVWSHQFDDDDSDIRGRFFEADGTPITNDIAISDTTDDETEASIASIPIANDDNNFDVTAGVITFTREIDGDDDIFFTTYGNEGDEVIGPTVAVSDDNLEKDQSESSVAIDADGNFVISFTNEFADDDDDVVLRRFEVDGTPIDELEIPVDSAFGDQNNSEVALADDGTIVVAYEDDVNENVRFRQFLNLGEETEQISEPVTYDVIATEEKNPALAINGNTLVITADDIGPQEDSDIFNPYARIFNDRLVDINRFQNEDVPGTFLFASESESVNVRNDFPNFDEEGLAFQVFSQEEDDLIRINRFQNLDVPGTFLFATEGESVDIRQKFPQFEEEGIAFYAYGAGDERGEEYFRFRNTQFDGTYIFVNQEERDNILADPNLSQFELEGVSFGVA